MELADSGITAVQLPPAQIKAFAPSWGRLTKTDRFDTELIARYMAFRPKAGKELPDENLSILRTLKTRRGQLVDMRKWLKAQISARNKQGISADVEIMDDELRETFDTQIDAIERRIEDGIAQVETLADKVNLLRSMPPPRGHWSGLSRDADCRIARIGPDDVRRDRRRDRLRAGST